MKADTLVVPPMIHTLARRRFLSLCAAGLTLNGITDAIFAQERMVSPKTPQGRPSGSLTDIPGIRVGHFTDSRRPTGCTVILFDNGATASVEVRGSAPGTRETDLLAPTNMVQQINAILLSGGSAFGLDAAGGVVKYLEENKIGFDVGVARVPIVPAAILFDLGVGDAKIRPTAESGYKACQAAKTTGVEEGSVGAGAGATVGKMLGPKNSMKGGIGMASLLLPDGLRVAALVAVNALGDIRDPGTGKIVAGARTPDGKGFADTGKLLREGKLGGSTFVRAATNTTLGVVATNAPLTKTDLLKVAQMAHDGFARAIEPVHTPFDGDTIFAVSVPEKINGKLLPADAGRVGILAANVVADAIVRAALTATGVLGIPSASELTKPAASPW